MKKLIVVAAVLMLTGSLHASVTNFEDLTFTSQYSNATDYNPYNGWTIGGGGGGSFLYAPAYSAGSAVDIGTNGNYSLSQWGFGTTTLSRTSAFYLVSLALTPSSSTGHISVTGMLGASTQFTKTYDFTSVTQILASETEWASKQIDSLIIHNWDGAYLSKGYIDDITWTTQSGGTVPAPSALLLLSSGLVAIPSLLRRLQHS